jgi:ubiquinone/menaquinone biosynthesis C-methylase UbiE
MSANAQQIADWDGLVGETWVRMQDELDRVTAPFGEAALAAAAPREGERVVDLGCGCGTTSLALASSVGEGGAVLGLDVSGPMLAQARRRAAGMAQLSFRQGDAAFERLPAEHDLIFSRFGIMFFDDPGGAFVNMRAWLRPAGRIAFCCWRHPRDNPWATVPAIAAREALNIEAAPIDPYAPGPFAFADAERLRGLMEAAGFEGFHASAFDQAIMLGRSVQEAAEMMTHSGPGSRLVREAGEPARPIAAQAIARALEPHAAANGSVSLMGAVWVVSACVV